MQLIYINYDVFGIEYEVRKINSLFTGVLKSIALNYKQWIESFAVNYNDITLYRCTEIDVIFLLISQFDDCCEISIS